MERRAKEEHVAHDPVDLRISAGRQRGRINHGQCRIRGVMAIKARAFASETIEIRGISKGDSIRPETIPNHQHKNSSGAVRSAAESGAVKYSQPECDQK